MKKINIKIGKIVFYKPRYYPIPIKGGKWIKLWNLMKVRKNEISTPGENNR
jgi:hypothetical protein